MGANVEWFYPEEVSECWSYRGRLYKTEKTARREQERDQKMAAECREKWGDEKYADRWWNHPEQWDIVYHISIVAEALPNA